MKDLLLLTRQSGDKVFVNPNNINYITTTEYMGQLLTEVNFVGAGQQSLLVTETFEEVSEKLEHLKLVSLQYEN
tara:strand:+ start:102 stop:323 length:222 start_codon:yes stop_codon:yes gene_type:complete